MLVIALSPAVVGFSSPASAVPVSATKTTSQSFDFDWASDGKTGCDTPHLLTGLTISVTPTVDGEEREIDSRVKIHLTSSTSGLQAMACLIVKCTGASFGPGGPDNVQTVSNVVQGESSRIYRARGLVTFPTAGQTYTCETYLSAQKGTKPKEGPVPTGTVVLDSIDSVQQYGTLSASSAVDPVLSEHCYHTTDVRTGDCYDNWANFSIDAEGNQGIADASGAANTSHRTDVKLDNVPVGTVLTLNATVYVTTCNTQGTDACPANLGSGNATLTTVIRQIATGCDVSLTRDDTDPDYWEFNGTDTGTVTTAQHHGVVFAQKKITVTGYTSGSTSCSIKAWSDTTTSGRSVNVHGTHTRLYTVHDAS